jgi:hypothetical protein
LFADIAVESVAGAVCQLLCGEFALDPSAPDQLAEN